VVRGWKQDIVAEGDCSPLAIASLELGGMAKTNDLHQTRSAFSFERPLSVIPAEYKVAATVKLFTRFFPTFSRFLFHLPRRIIRSGLPWIDNAWSWCITLGPVFCRTPYSRFWVQAICYLDLPL